MSKSERVIRLLIRIPLVNAKRIVMVTGIEDVIRKAIVTVSVKFLMNGQSSLMISSDVRDLMIDSGILSLVNQCECKETLYLMADLMMCVDEPLQVTVALWLLRV